MYDGQVKEPSAGGLIPLGPGLRVPPLGVGTWAWGDRLLWGYGREYSHEDLRAAFTISVAAGLRLFDTAEVYSGGRSERLLGSFARMSKTSIVVATKFMPYPWRLRRDALRRALRRSLQRLGLPTVDLYMVHWPFPPVPIETWMDAMADAVADGLVSAVGVSNYSRAQLRRAHAALARRGIPLAANQVKFSLLDRAPLTSGLLAACRDLGVTLVAWNPLAMGVLTGKYSPAAPPRGLHRRHYHARFLARVQPLLALLRRIGERYGKTRGQVALNWIIGQGALPIPGAKNADQAAENAGALGWSLRAEDAALLDRAWR